MAVGQNDWTPKISHVPPRCYLSFRESKNGWFQYFISPNLCFCVLFHILILTHGHITGCARWMSLSCWRFWLLFARLKRLKKGLSVTQLDSMCGFKHVLCSSLFFSAQIWVNLLTGKLTCPLKINGWNLEHAFPIEIHLGKLPEPKNHLFEKENHLPNLHVWVPC